MSDVNYLMKLVYDLCSSYQKQKQLQTIDRKPELVLVMFFVNPKYEAAALTNAQKRKRSVEIQSLLMISKDERTSQKKRQIYEYFINNAHLIQIQRSKSLRARLLCVEHIELITQQEFVSARLSIRTENKKQQEDSKQKDLVQVYIIIQKFEHDSTLAVLRQQYKDKIIQQNQEPIKQMMGQLKQFSLLKHFQYHQLLYLAHYVQNIKPVPYKEYVFQQNQKADCIYFLQEGEFQVFKNSVQFQNDKIIQNIKNSKQMSPLNKFITNQESPYKNKKNQINRKQLSKIQGGSGQSFGQIQFFLSSQTRLFSLRSNSLTSKIFKINFKYFQEVFNNKVHRFIKLKKQYALKLNNDLDKVKLHKEIKDRIGSPLNKLSQEQQERISLNKKLSTIILEIKKHNSMDNDKFQSTFTPPNNSLTIPVGEIGANRNNYRQNKLFSQNAKKMKINQFGPRISSGVSTSVGQYPESIGFKVPSIERPFFPLINKNHKSKNQQDFKNTPPGILTSKRSNKIKGLVDINMIIKQKEELYNSMSGVPNPQFSFYKLDQKNTKRLNFQKSQLLKVQTPDKSPAHSSQYLKDFVKRSLKKSRYYQENFFPSYNNSIGLQTISRTKTQQLVNTSSFSIQEEGENERTLRYCQIEEKMPYVMKNQVKASLMSNDYDKFFHKI